MTELQYFKTDKNGTRYYYDWTCPRCGGAGGSDNWAYTGWTCYECGGTGKALKPQIVKEYTEEYRAILDERNAKRHAKENAEREAKAEQQLEADKAKFLEKNGFNKDGYTYIFLGDTYPIKDKIKSAGGKFDYTLGWHIDHEVNGFQFMPVHIDEVADVAYFHGYTYKDGASADIEKRAKEEYTKMNNITPSEWVGEVGDKVQIEAVLVIEGSFESYFGYRPTTTYVYTFTDDDDNDFVWKTSSWDNMTWGSHPAPILEIGDRAIITGTIKEHSEYKGEKQTVLTRCKVVKA